MELSDYLAESLRHTLSTRQAGVGVIGKALAPIDNMNAAIAAILRDRNPKSPIQWHRLFQRLRALSRDGMSEMVVILKRELRSYVRAETHFQRDLLVGWLGKRRALPKAIYPRAMNHAMPAMRALTVAELIARTVSYGRRDLENQVRAWHSQGLNADQVARRLLDHTGDLHPHLRAPMQRHLRTTVHTAMHAISTHSRIALYQASPSITRYAYLAIWDIRPSNLRTTMSCMSLHGNISALGEGPVPPRHPGCRSIVVGLRQHDRLEDLAGISNVILQPDAWLQSQPVDWLARSVGRARAKHVKAGQLSYREFWRHAEHRVNPM
ncbi:MAG: hypothetical protein ACR2QC_01385 [Gammaproteobacteria bacterium]